MYFSWDWGYVNGGLARQSPINISQSQLKYEINLSHVFLKKNII